MNPSRSIAAGIVQSLQDQSWAEDLTIVRAYRADWELKNFSGTKVTVMPNDQVDERETREGLDREYTINILIQQKLDIDPKANPAERNLSEVAVVDPAMDLFDRIGSHLFMIKTAGPGRWMRHALRPISDKDLHTSGLYAAMLSITYKYFYDSEWATDNVNLSPADFLAKWGPDGLGAVAP